MVGQFLCDRQVVFLDHPGDERTPEIMGHDFYPHLRPTLPGDVVDRMLGDALAGDVAAPANAVEQERIVRFAFLEL
ncbi:hypothetical protein D3C71_1105350 [compost metagenome]